MVHLGRVIDTLGRWAPSAVPFAQERASGWHPMWGFWGPWGVAMMLMMFVFWGAVLMAVMVGIRWLIRQSQAGRVDPALDILRQRYARGEINREEFETKKRDLAP
jgi:putative membrane protein